MNSRFNLVDFVLDFCHYVGGSRCVFDNLFSFPCLLKHLELVAVKPEMWPQPPAVTFRQSGQKRQCASPQTSERNRSINENIAKGTTDPDIDCFDQ